MIIIKPSIFTGALLGSILVLERQASAFYFNQYQGPLVTTGSGNLYANYDNAQHLRQAVSQQQQQSSEDNTNSIWNPTPASSQDRQYQDDSSNNQAQYVPYPPLAPRALFYGMPQSDDSQPQESAHANVCTSGFVEHCLVQANNDGEQRLLASMIANRTGQLSDQEALVGEFDGMCHIVIRFIDCLNAHYYKCAPVAKHSEMMKAKDIFAESWMQLCSDHGQVRQKYLQHSTCIKQALTEHNGQEECQSRFQTFFMSGSFSLDSIESAVHYGCCAFNEWQYCIDSLIVKQCGHEAMKSVQDLIDKASGGLVTSLCDKKSFGRKSKTCMGKMGAKTGYGVGAAKLAALDPKINATLHKYISIFGDFIDRLPDDDE